MKMESPSLPGNGAEAVGAVVPPLFRVGPCSSLREAGVQHGILAADRIKGFLLLPELDATRAFVSAGGAEAFADLRADNERAFPQYAAEIEGMAEGSGVALDDIWMMNLLAEVQGLMRFLPVEKRVESCSDVMLRGEGALWHGHNEDWTGNPKNPELIYFVAYVPDKDATFLPIMGMCYPGMIPGFAMTWVSGGLFLTQNSLFPPAASQRGIGCTFAARHALEETSIDRAVLRLTAPGLAFGCSVNLVAIPSEKSSSSRACNIEIHGAGDTAAVQWLGSAPGSTLNHFNVYKNLAVGNANDPRNSASRQTRATELLVDAQTGSDVAAVLSDCTAATFPLFRKQTLVSWLLDVQGGVVSVWAGVRPTHALPAYVWNIATFWDEP